MPQSLQHTQWFVDTGNRLQTEDGKHVEVWEFNHCEDEHMPLMIPQRIIGE